MLRDIWKHLLVWMVFFFIHNVSLEKNNFNYYHNVVKLNQKSYLRLKHWYYPFTRIMIIWAFILSSDRRRGIGIGKGLWVHRIIFWIYESTFIHQSPNTAWLLVSPGKRFIYSVLKYYQDLFSLFSSFLAVISWAIFDFRDWHSERRIDCSLLRFNLNTFYKLMTVAVIIDF